MDTVTIVVTVAPVAATQENIDLYLRMFATGLLALVGVWCLKKIGSLFWGSDES